MILNGDQFPNHINVHPSVTVNELDSSITNVLSNNDTSSCTSEDPYEDLSNFSGKKFKK